MKPRLGYTDLDLINAVKASTSVRQVLIKLGLCPKGGGSYRTLYNQIHRLNLDMSHFTGQGSNKGRSFGHKRPIEDYLTNKYPIHSHSLRLRLIRDGYLKQQCCVCKRKTWQGKVIPLELDHLDGDHNNNCLTNIRIICPNCHAQTPNHAGKNKGHGNYSPAA